MTMQVTRIVLAVAMVSMAMGCVSKREVRTVEDYDYSMSCEALVTEIRRLEDLRRDMDNESGFTGKNVANALLFWPGIFVNESRATSNVRSVDDRISHLNRVRGERKCYEQSGTPDVSAKT